MTANVSAEGTARPFQAFQKMLGLKAEASPILRLGLIHMWPIEFWLKQRVPSAAWRHGHHRVTVTWYLCPLERPLLAKARCDLRHGAQNVVTTEAFNKGWGALCGGQPTFSLWSEKESILPFGHTGTPCASTLRQQVRGVMHKSPGQPRLEETLHAGEWPSFVGPEQSVLTEGDKCSGKMNHGADMLSRNRVSSEEWTLHPLVVQKIWEVCGRARVDLFASEDNSHCPIFFTKSMDALAQSSALCFPSNRSSTAGTQASQVAMAQTHSNMLWAALLSRFFRRNLRCSGEAAYIARRPAHFGGLWRAA